MNSTACDSGATVNSLLKPIDEYKNTIISSMAARGDTRTMSELPKKAKIDVPNMFGWTPLMVAVRNGHVECAKILLERMANSTMENLFGGSVFMCAVASGNLKMVKFMLNYLQTGGVSRSSIEMVFSPISIAILFDHEKIFHFLLEKQFRPDFVNQPELTPLLFASMNTNQLYWQELKKRVKHLKKNPTHRPTLKMPMEINHYVPNSEQHNCSQSAHVGGNENANPMCNVTYFGTNMEPHAMFSAPVTDMNYMSVPMMNPQAHSAPYYYPMIMPIVRTSSNVHTPVFSPINISPITPLNGPTNSYCRPGHFFFPAEYPTMSSPFMTTSPAGCYVRGPEEMMIMSPVDDEVFYGGNNPYQMGNV